MRPILVIPLMAYRHGNITLPMLMKKIPNVRFISSREGNTSVVEDLSSLTRSNIVLLLVELLGNPLASETIDASGLILNHVFTAPPLEGAAQNYQIF